MQLNLLNHRCCAGTLNVVLYHGSNRGDNFTQDQLERADVVLTSFSIMEVDYRRNVMAPKATCKFCGKKYQPDRLKVHLRYFCGPYAQKTEAQAKQQKKRDAWLGGRGGGDGGAGDDDKVLLRLLFHCGIWLCAVSSYVLAVCTRNAALMNDWLPRDTFCVSCQYKPLQYTSA